jgi:hypothetical protein
MFCTLTFESPDLIFPTPNEARAWACSKLPLPPIVFQRNTQGRLSQETAVFSVTLKGRAIVLVGYGHTGVGELCRGLGNIRTAFEAQYPKGKFTFASGTLGITKSRPKRWRCDHFVIQSANASRANLWQRYQQDKTINLTEIAEPLFTTAINKRLASIESELGYDIVFGDFSATATSPVRLSEKMYQFAVNLDFTTNAEFHGPWFIGRLSNKGCGRIHRIFPDNFEEDQPESNS